MIAIDLAQTLRDRLASEIDINIVSDDKLVVYMPFVYEDGDHFSVYASRTDQGWLLSDLGDVSKRASYQLVNINGAAIAQRISDIAGFYGVGQTDGALDIVATDEEMPDAVFTLTQTCLEAALASKAQTRSKRATEARGFPQKLARLVANAVPRDSVTENYHDVAADPRGIYPIDHRIEGKRRQLFLFGVWGPESCMRATIACQHYRMHDVKFDAVAVYRNEEKLAKRFTEPLNEVVDKRFPRISESKAIKKYLAGIAA